VRLTIPTIQLRNKSLILYDQIDGSNYYSPSLKFKQSLNMKLQQDKQYSGRLTDGAKKRLSKAIDLLCQSIRPVKVRSCIHGRLITHRVSFITLTISHQENLSARESYDKAFVHFMQWMRRTAGVTTYVWKCEVQKRGQIHYHITTPSYLDYREIRTKWNALQQRNGWLDSYHLKHGHYNPNSTDIHEAKKIDNMSSYLIKEFCKAIQNPNTDGKIWDCSLNLKKFKYYSFSEEQRHNELISDLITNEKVEVIKLDRCMVIKMKKGSTTEVLNIKEMQIYNDLLELIRNYRQD